MSIKNINEIGYRVASLTHGANYNAQKSEILNNDINENYKKPNIFTIKKKLNKR